MVISELDIDGQIEMIETHPFDNDERLINANPLGRIPCLVDNGEAIMDSEVICDYLDANISGGVLFNPIYADWRLKTLYSLCSGLQDSCMARQMEVLRDKEGIRSEFWWERYSQAICRALKEIESKLSLLPEDFSILHINLMSALGYLDFRHSDINWRDAHPELLAFHNQFKERVCVKSNPFSG